MTMYGAKCEARSLSCLLQIHICYSNLDLSITRSLFPFNHMYGNMKRLFVYSSLVFLVMFFRDPRGTPERDQVYECMSMVCKNMNSRFKYNQPSKQLHGC